MVRIQSIISFSDYWQMICIDNKKLITREWNSVWWSTMDALLLLSLQALRRPSPSGSAWRWETPGWRTLRSRSEYTVTAFLTKAIFNYLLMSVWLYDCFNHYIFWREPLQLCHWVSISFWLSLGPCPVLSVCPAVTCERCWVCVGGKAEFALAFGLHDTEQQCPLVTQLNLS